MEHDQWEAFLEAERERRKTPREREIEKELAAIAIKHRRALQAETEPLVAELAKIEAAKPPMPIMVDGNVFEYVGPGAQHS